jgi:hypothetical protein
MYWTYVLPIRSKSELIWLGAFFSRTTLWLTAPRVRIRPKLAADGAEVYLTVLTKGVSP